MTGHAVSKAGLGQYSYSPIKCALNSSDKRLYTGSISPLFYSRQFLPWPGPPGGRWRAEIPGGGRAGVLEGSQQGTEVGQDLNIVIPRPLFSPQVKNTS